MSILNQIIANKKLEIEVSKQKIPLNNLKQQLKKSLYIPKKISKSEFFLISEIKPKSPSAGEIISNDLNPIELAKKYENSGANALSVLTDSKYFGGSENLLHSIRSSTNLPILRKDFIINPYQVYETKLLQADLILLIAKILDKEKIDQLLELSLKLGLQPLIEIQNKIELETVLKTLKQEDFSKIIIGVNNRNLETFEVNLQTSLDLVSLIPDQFIKLSLSGIETTQHLNTLKDAGFDGVLIGTSLVTNPELLTYFKPSKTKQMPPTFGRPLDRGIGQS